MKTLFKKSVTIISVFAALLISSSAIAQSSSCCSSSKVKDSKPGCAIEGKDRTSGCTPSNCRGAKTKFGEAKIITDLRTKLISLKAMLEKSEDPIFDKRTYSVHGIVGETDDESLEIIKNEVVLIEKEYGKIQLMALSKFVLPKNKSKQVQYLDQRISDLKQIL